MNIKIKAGIAVLVCLTIFTGISVAILSIPDHWVKEYGLLIFQAAVVVVGLCFMYMMALDYFRSQEKIKALRESEKKN